MDQDMKDSKENDQQVVKQVCENLDASIERMDAETRHKLIAIRENALAQRQPMFILNWAKAAFATVFAVALSILIINTQLPFTADNSLEEESIEAMELMAAQDTLELYEELEFYAWLAEEDAAS